MCLYLILLYSWHLSWIDISEDDMMVYRIVRWWIKISLPPKIGVGDFGMGWNCSRTSTKKSISSLLDLKSTPILNIIMPSIHHLLTILDPCLDDLLIGWTTKLHCFIWWLGSIMIYMDLPCQHWHTSWRWSAPRSANRDYWTVIFW